MRKQWVIEGEAGKYYRVAEYFYAVYDKATEEDPDDPTLKREITTRRIMWSKLNGVEWLDEPQEWDGRYLPIIQDSGTKFNVGGKVSYEGLIQPNESPCRMLNYMVSAAAETIGLRSLAPWIGAAGQFEGYEAWWDQANTRNFSKLEYNAVTDATGPTLLPPPQRNNEEPAVRAFTEMIGLFTNFIRSTTGVSDAALGHVNSNDRSGRAIEQLKRSSEQGASNWLGNHASAIRHTGVVLVDLLPHVYDRPGRVERILGMDDEASPVMLNAPFVRGEDGTPQPPPAAPTPSLFGRMKQAVGLGAPAAPPASEEGPEVEHHDLSEGEYSVVVTVGKSADTRRQEMQVGLGQLAMAAPELVPRFADVWVGSMDIPGAEEIAERLKPAGIDGNAGIPPEAQAQIQQLQQALQESKALSDANQTKLVIAAKSDATKKEIAEIQAQTTIAAAEIKAGMADMANQIKVLATMIGTEHEARMLAKEHDYASAQQLHDSTHEIVTTAMQHAHEREMAAQDHMQTLQQGDQAHQQALEQGAQPPPLDPNAAASEDRSS
jgi:hypothetical protein